jgi:carbon-monoxide dehydrogenase iron sulfur subunit
MENNMKSIKLTNLKEDLKKNQIEIMLYPAKCDGCEGQEYKSCVQACETHMKEKYGKYNTARINIKSKGNKFFPILCHNCEEAPCVDACMPGARYRDIENGWTLTNYKKCVGCWMCVMVCPFGAIERVGKDHYASKCDGCIDEETPKCVEACKKGALKKIGIKNYSYERRLMIANKLYGPHLKINYNRYKNNNR